ncbi:glycosyltransferase family 4 protein [Thiocapsa marina]|uniref:Glycosyl transferase group 1 n=1 Tax=Thiocapsa marina 5811 TaxID=768671 RepID=F9UIJ6_9GAMM|nr:glycosyltransferase family 4 protein [Thiocapsa marina]EGV15978.1 glycosyl transferase group 1 [Thiocapsa marina 5811]
MSKRICFVGLDNYPVLNPAKGHEYFGGEAVQQTLLAKAFRDLGYAVSMVDRDFGQPDGEVIDGIRVWKTMKEGDGLPGFRFFHPRLTSVARALRQADADIYYQSCAGVMTGAVAWFCRRNGRKFAFRIAHDTDCIPGKHILGRLKWRDAMIYRYGIRRADLIASQSKIQSKLLKDNFQLKSQIINLAVEPPSPADRGAERDIDVLWVNNIRDFKRPELVPELAKRLPQFRFVMIGGQSREHEGLYSDVENKCRTVPNLEFLGQVPYRQVNRYFSRSKVFVNTSDSEGFPNSFLQAWIRGVPVVSFFDPDQIIARKRLGAVPDSIEGMADTVAEILGNRNLIDGLSQNARDYAERHHSPDVIASQYIELLSTLPAQDGIRGPVFG